MEEIDVIIIATIAALLILIMLFWLLWSIHSESCGWKLEMQEADTLITFAEFRCLFDNDPYRSAWELNDGCVHYIPTDTTIAFRRHRDYHRYIWFHKKLEKQQKEAHDLENLLTITRQVRKRINKDANKAFDDVNKAKRRQRDIVNRIGQEKHGHGKNGKI